MAEFSRLDQLDQAIGAMLAGAAPVPADDAEFAALLAVCDRLRDLPDEDFKARLKSDLERRASMTASTAPYVREGFRNVTPYIMVPEGAALIEFMKTVFDAEDRGRNVTPGGFHGEVRLGDSMFMIGGGEALRGRERTSAFHVYVPDCDAVYRRAIGAGATSLGEPKDHSYGERAGYVQDPFGNHWYIATRLQSMLVPEGLGNVLPFLHPTSAARLVDFLERTFGGRELQRFEHGGRVVHTAVQIGNAVVEMGEPEEDRRQPAAFFVYVEDADAAYERALAAGAISLWPPADQPYGYRVAGVQDPFGYQWFPATPLPDRNR